MIGATSAAIRCDFCGGRQTINDSYGWVCRSCAYALMLTETDLHEIDRLRLRDRRAREIGLARENKRRMKAW